jgi:electron transfer flavoprotein alpha subunit
MFSTSRSTALRQLNSQFHSLRLSQSHNPAAYARLLSSLAIVEQRDGKLQTNSLGSIAAAQKLGGSVTAFVAGTGAKSAAEQAAKVKGVEKVIYVDNSAYERGLAEVYAPLIIENAKKGGFSHILVGHSAFGKSVMPRVAALLDTQQISDIMEIKDEKSKLHLYLFILALNNQAYVRPMYAGNAIVTVESSDETQTITVRGTNFQVTDLEGGSATLEEGVDPKESSSVEWASENLTKSDRPELASATRVVSGGRGLKSKEEFDRLIPALADALGAAIGASRAAVDSGFADNSLQVGQTGKNVAPQLYLCAGISGAIQHLAGMKDSKVIAAINKDPEAPIFQVADVGLVGDLFDKVPELTEKLNASN